MGLKAYQEKILQQLILQEKMLSKLYEHFSEQFAEYSEFWKKLSKEEQRHAILIQKLFNAAKNETIFFDEGKIKTYTLDAFILRLEDILQRRRIVNLA